MRISDRPGYRHFLTLLITGSLGLMGACTGCEQKEKVLDIKAPGIDVEVNKTSDGGREVKITPGAKDKDKVKIETN